MKTVVLQTFRDYNVPEWITLTMKSVREWSASRNYDYVFIGDEFFDYAPPWVHDKCGAQRLPITDFARLHYLKDYLSRGYERVVWVDADVLVFRPELFDINVPSGYAFSREILMLKNQDGKLHIGLPGINNAVMLFEQGNPMLDFYLLAAESILRQVAPGRLKHTAIGTEFLSKLARTMPLARLNCVGLFTPLLMADIAEGGRTLWPIYQKAFKYPMSAANLCGSMTSFSTEQQNTEEKYVRAIGQLLGRNIDGEEK
ncbi:MAG: hypothetical protein CVU34_07155 [Betaproteobacteria bacterium HGW-Betaproteobacteria-7]|jgi:hypothetical protein|nr:MAG: hypothetical protein CVU34_07155 [Betaproteobacteria bacterium HGW-Betaproteobacteria-7]